MFINIIKFEKQTGEKESYVAMLWLSWLSRVAYYNIKTSPKMSQSDGTTRVDVL